MTRLRKILCGLAVALLRVSGALGHGFMAVPASRNYLAHKGGAEDDHHGGCCRGGGPDVVYKGGHFPKAPKLGSACGDAAGVNKYGSTGSWGRKGGSTKVKTGTAITVKITLTANHAGVFLFNLCPGTAESMDCFAKTALPVDATGKLFFAPVKGQIGDYDLKVRLPPSVKGPAVLQWVYLSANSCCLSAKYGGDPSCNMTPCEGDGPNPEEFWNCSDLEIGADGDGSAPGAAKAQTQPAGAAQTQPAAAAQTQPAAAATGTTTDAGAAAAAAAPAQEVASAAAATPVTPQTVTVPLTTTQVALIGTGNGVAVVALGVAVGFAGGAAVGAGVGAVLALISALLWYFLYIKKKQQESFRAALAAEGAAATWDRDDGSWATALPSPPPIPLHVPGEEPAALRRRRVARVAMSVARAGVLSMAPGPVRDAVRLAGL